MLENLAWWTADYAYAAWWQTRAALDRTDPAQFRSGTERPLVVIPGIYETWRFLQPLIATVHARGHPVHVVDALRRNGGPVVDAAEQVSGYVLDHDLDGVVLVAHSKGGLVGKQVMVATAAASRVIGMVAVAAPFAGSVYGNVMLTASLRAFAPRDPTIVALGRAAERNDRVVSVYARFDPHIPGGSRLAGARNVRLDTGGHFRILAHPRIPAEIERLSRDADARTQHPD